MFKLVLLRHGESDWNRENRFTGWTDVDLSEKGIEEAKRDVFAKLENRLYPFDGQWLNWLPDPNWEPPKLPVNWDKI